MRRHIRWLAVVLIAASGFGQAPVQPVIVSKPEAQGAVTRVEVRPHFVTAIQMPEAVNSVAVGDPKLFQVEHSPNEPTVVFVKALTTEPAESNLLISTGEGQETSLLVVSHGASSKSVDFVVEYKRAGSFMIAPDYPADLIGETVPISQSRHEVSPVPEEGPMATASPASLAMSVQAPSRPLADRARPGALDALLTLQEHAPLPKLYGEHSGVENPHGDQVKAGVSEVIDGGEQVIVLFSVINPTNHAILLVPPQVQLGGKIRTGKIFRHSRWTAAEQLPVEEFRLSTWRLASGARADGVVMFARPPYKQSNETLFLQVAEAGAIDKPALAPIGFGVNKLRVEEATNGRAGK
ncbi:MAG TPA: hypothetical protein VGX94_01350 [Terriglobia bacterium]|nr:hypothetical protein [Terriglobia bacterium]